MGPFFYICSGDKMKNVLSMAVACVLSGVMLTACGVVVTITVAAAMVATMAVAPTPAASPSHCRLPGFRRGGLDYRCNDYTGVTNAKGEFLFDDGDTCEFALGNQRLGR